jgi:hypothetical protein
MVQLTLWRRFAPKHEGLNHNRRSPTDRRPDWVKRT